MKKSFNKLLQGYQEFRKKYASGDNSVMEKLAFHGQKPEIMFIACSDSRVDPGLILQCDPGELFIVRNVANIVPPFEKDSGYHGTSAALEFGICYLKVKHLIILGHSQCGGINALINKSSLHQNDFISHWVSILDKKLMNNSDCDSCSKQALSMSQQNCLTFPWIKERVDQNELTIHQWFFDIKSGKILTHSSREDTFHPLIET